MQRIIKILTIFFFIGSIDPLFSYMPNQVQAMTRLLQNPDAKINCAGCDLRGVQDFIGLDLHGVFMPGVSMQPCLQTDINKNSMMVCIPEQTANLTGTNLSRTILFSSCLDGAILDKADLTGADLTGTSLEYASLKDAIVKDLITDKATFCHAIMPDGTECINSWTGQGITINCNCGKDQAATGVEQETEKNEPILQEKNEPVVANS